MAVRHVRKGSFGSFQYIFNVSRGQPALAEWSAENASFREHSRMPHQGLIRVLFPWIVSPERQRPVPVPQKLSTVPFPGFVLFLIISWLSIMAAVIDH